MAENTEQSTESICRPPTWKVRFEALSFFRDNRITGYEHAINQVKKLAKGEAHEVYYDELYKGWTSDQLKDLLRELGETPD